MHEIDAIQFAILFAAVLFLIVGWFQTAKSKTAGLGEFLGIAGLLLLALDAFILLARIA
jgi:hypothetical protein